MKINETTNILEGVNFIPSPNFDERPEEANIDLLVIHGISLPPGQFEGRAIEQLFTNQLDPNEHEYFAEIHDLEVSAHLLIRREGEIIQFVPFDKRAWHAGESKFEDREKCSDFSIGIELEGTDDLPYTEAQYAALQKTTRCLMDHFNGITEKRIVGHSDIAPGRKTDPGECFDWPYFLSLMK